MSTSDQNHLNTMNKLKQIREIEIQVEREVEALIAKYNEKLDAIKAELTPINTLFVKSRMISKDPDRPEYSFYFACYDNSQLVVDSDDYAIAGILGLSYAEYRDFLWEHDAIHCHVMRRLVFKSRKQAEKALDALIAYLTMKKLNEVG